MWRDLEAVRCHEGCEYVVGVARGIKDCKVANKMNGAAHSLLFEAYLGMVCACHFSHDADEAKHNQQTMYVETQRPELRVQFRYALLDGLVHIWPPYVLPSSFCADEIIRSPEKVVGDEWVAVLAHFRLCEG